MASWPASGVLNITLVGAGNLTHVLAGQLSARADCRVSVLSRKANDIAEHMTTVGVTVKIQAPTAEGKDEFVTGKCYRVSADPADVIPEADLIIMTTPSHGRPAMCKQIVPHVSKDKTVYFGVMPGMGGFDWIARQVCTEHKADNVVVWGVKDVPFMASHTVPGKSATNLGPKKDLYLAMANHFDKRDWLADTLFNLTKINVVKLSTFMVITLTPGNPIMHPSIMYGMFGPYSQWDGKPLPEKPLFYENVSELSSYFLTKCDEEVQAIKNAIIKATGADLEAVWPLRLNLKKVYGDIVRDNRTLMLAMRTNRAYESIRTPLKQVEGGFTVDVDHRFFLEDVPYGLIVLRDIADILGVATPVIDEITQWCQKLMGKEYLVERDGKLVLQGANMSETGAPSVYSVKRIEDLVASTTVKA